MRTHLLNVPTPKFSSTIHSRSGIEVVTCVVETEEGLTGLGFTYTVGTGGSAIKAIIDDYVAKVLIGSKPEETATAWERMWRTTHGVGRGGVTTHAIAAVDIALWDLKGREADKPLYELLGGIRKPIPLYATDGGWLHCTEAELVKNALKVASKRYVGFKIKVGKKEAKEDVDRIKAVIDAAGDKISVMVDVNQGFGLSEATKRGKLYQDLGVGWYEEPLVADDFQGYGRLARDLSMPIAVGENIFTKYEFERYMQAGACDLIQPDVCRLGGITEWMQVAEMAHVNGLEVSPHIIMELHGSLAASIPNATYVEDLPG